MKIKVSIYGGEAFPIYEVHDDERWHGQIEIDRETYERWKKAFLEFQNVQEEIVEAMKSAGHDNWGTACQDLWDA